MAELSVTGIEQLVGDMETVVKKYPDMAGKYLEKTARDLRKDIVKTVKRETKTKGSGKESLAKAGAYSISKAQGLGSDQFVDISAKSSHFHLVEHGHNLIINGENRGFVPGKHMMENTSKKYARRMPDIVENMVDTLLKENGL